MKASSFYYQRARKCEKLASDTHALSHRLTLFKIAAEWLAMARLAEIRETRRRRPLCFDLSREPNYSFEPIGTTSPSRSRKK